MGAQAGAARRDIELAHQRGCRVVRLCFDEPDGLSPVTADPYRAWNQRRGVAASRLLIESFILLDPCWALRTGAVPFWMRFNMGPSLDRVRRYLAEAGSFDEIYLKLFAHDTDSLGLPSIADWRTVLDQARTRGAFLDVDESAYPAHFARYARHDETLRKLSPVYDLPDPLSVDAFARLLPAGEAARLVAVPLTGRSAARVKNSAEPLDATSCPEQGREAPSADRPD